MIIELITEINSHEIQLLPDGKESFNYGVQLFGCLAMKSRRNKLTKFSFQQPQLEKGFTLNSARKS